MRVNIFKHEFKMHLRSVITWSLAISALILVYVSLFTSFSKDAALLNEMMQNFPDELLTAFGLKGVDLSTVLGYFSFVFLFVQLCLAIQAANYGFGLVSIEEREWTADFLLAKPVSRAHILTSKLLAAFTGMTLTNAVVWISSIGFIRLFASEQPYRFKPLLLILLSIVVFQLFFFGVGLLVSLIVKRIRSVTPYAMGLGFGMYVLSVFGDMLGESVFELITPFKHFYPQYIVVHEAYNPSLVWISLVVICISIAGSYMLYLRRDIPAVV